MANRNLELLKVAAMLLRPVLDELVFVGGCATGLLVSDEAAAEVRPTFDVEAIAEITSYVEYTTFGERLHKLGFTEDASEGAPICAGNMVRSGWISCLWTKRFLAFPTAGIRQRWTQLMNLRSNETFAFAL